MTILQFRLYPYFERAKTELVGQKISVHFFIAHKQTSIMDRRSFIQKTGMAGAAVLAPPYLIPFRPAKYKTVLIGSGWWGLNILREAIRSGQITVAALCDVDDNQLTKCKQEVDKLCNDQPKIYKDYRDCIKSERPDIVINATPDHWHALIAIEALHSGAHVFLENPFRIPLKKAVPFKRPPAMPKRFAS